jgi:MFS family permease
MSKSLQQDVERRSSIPLITIVTCIAYLALALTATGWGPVLLPLAVRLSLPVETVGLLYVAWSLGYLPGALIGGALLDRYGPRRVLLAAACLMLAGMTAIVLALSLHLAPFAGLALCAGIAGSGGGTMEVASNGVMSSLYVRKRGVALNLFMTLYPLGAFLIFFVDAALLLRFQNDPRPLLLVALGALSVSIVALLLLPRTLPTASDSQMSERPSELPRAGSKGLSAVLPTLLPVMIAMLLTTGFIAAVRTWTPSYLHLRYGQTAALAAALGGLTNGMMVCCRLLMTLLIARIGAWRTLTLGLLVTILGLLTLLLSPGLMMGMVALAITAIGMTPMMAMFVSIGSDRVGHSPGTVSGLLFCTTSISTIVSSESFGVLLGRAGPLWAVAFCLVCLIAGEIVVVSLRKERAQ